LPKNEPIIIAELKLPWRGLGRSKKLWTCCEKQQYDVEGVMTAKWYLDPLDRVYLSSEEFCTECLYT
jgi:hypothetical protein